MQEVNLLTQRGRCGDYGMRIDIAKSTKIQNAVRNSMMKKAHESDSRNV